MDQKTFPKIKRIINQRLNIDNPKKIRLLSKNHYTKVNSIHYHPDDGDKLDSLFAFVYTNEVLSRLFEKIKVKPIKKLNLRDGYFALLNHNYPRMIKLIKRYSHIQELSLVPRLYDDDNEGWEKRIYWLKYVKRLKKAEFTCFSEDDEELYDKYLRYLRGSRLISLRLDNIDSEPEETCNFSVYPQTLRNLTLDDVSSLSSLNKLKNLEYLDLKVSKVSNDLVTDEMIDWLLKLKRIELSISSSSSNLDKLLKSLSKGNNLKSFVLENPDRSLLTKLEYFDSWAHLQSLSLRIVFDANKENELSFFSQLKTEISKLTKLRVLKLCFNGAGKKTKYTPVSSLIEKLTSLEELTLSFRGSAFEPEVFFDMIVIYKQISSLKKLNLSSEWIILLEDSCRELCKMIRSLKNLQVLELPSLVIPSAKLLRAITETIVEMGTLEKFEIGELLRSIPNDLLMCSLKKLLSLRSMKKFKISIPREVVTYQGSGGRKALNKIMREIERENPEVQVGQVYNYLTHTRSHKNCTDWKRIFGEYGYDPVNWEY